MMGYEVRARRRALGLKQSDLAKLMGTSPTTISHWENGKKRMSRPYEVAFMAVCRDVEAGRAQPPPIREHGWLRKLLLWALARV
jgi:transcriptional regulator with XRE-family HTH domain